MTSFKRYIRGSLIGVCIGIIISLMFSEMYKVNYMPSAPRFVNQFSNTTSAFLVSLLLWCVIGAFWTVSDDILRIKSWSLLKRSIVYFVVTYIGFTGLALLCGWFTYNWLIPYTIIYVVAYLVIWVVCHEYASK